MNILQVLPELKSGGVETGTVDLAKELISKGHKSVVISNGGELSKDLVKSGGIHYKLPVHEKSPITIISMIGKIRDIIKKEEIDIVHARSRVPAMSAFFAAHMMRVPFITTCHGYYSRHIFSRVMGWGKFVIVASNVIARHMIKNFGVPRERIRFIPRGVDLDKFQYTKPATDKPKKEYKIGIIGRITPIKGHVFLIRAISNVVRIMPNVKVMIIGDGPESKPKYRQELEMLTRRLSLSRYVQFLGNCQDIPEQIKKLDLLVMPSIGEEAFGRVIIEAQASGVPVIASRIGGIVDIIKDGENGILVPPRDWNRLSEFIIKLLKDAGLRERLSLGGRRSVEKRFTLSQMYKKTIKVYNEALSLYRILIIKWSALGDIILSLQALKAIRAKFPKAKITLITSRQAREFLSRYNYIDEFIIYNNNKGAESIADILSISSELRRSSVDLVSDLQNNKKSHIISFLSLAPRRIGYRSRKLDFLLTEAVAGSKEAMPPVEHQFKMLKPLGINTIPEPDPFIVTDEEQEYADKLLQNAWIAKKERLVGINCGASQKWKSKAWPAEKIAKFCDLLAGKKIRVVITGTSDDAQEARKILMLARSKPIDITGKTSIMELAAVIKRCSVFVTSDSAPLHVAALSGTPFVALFGPTDPKRHLQPSGRYRIIYRKLRCSPCYRADCKHRDCMNKIRPEEISAAVTELLKGKK